MQNNRKKLDKLRVGVIVGGTPEELNDAICTAHEVSKAVESLRNHVEIITFDDRFKRVIRYAKLDLAFLIDATFFGRTKIKNDLRRILTGLGIPYTGSKITAALITKNKTTSKKYFQKAGLLTPLYFEVKKQNFSTFLKFLAKKFLKTPYVIKPRDEGAGIDVTFARTRKDLVRITKNLLKKHKHLIIEHYIKGTEVTVPILEIKGKTIPLATIEIEKKVKVLSNDIKSLIQFSPKKEVEKVVKYHIPARISKNISEKVAQTAVAAHKAIGCESYSRVDMIVDELENVYVLEINSLPILSADGFFSKAAKLRGLSYKSLVDNIIQNTLNL